MPGRQPCPEGCTCGVHSRPKCPPGCTCGKHYRTELHNRLIGMSVSETARVKRESSKV